MNHLLQASDADREQTVTALRRHVADGRITVEEFSDRAATAYAARTLGDLATITADLPPIDHERPPDSNPQRARPAWLIAGLAASTVLGVGLLSVLTHAAAAAAPMMNGFCP
jgi:hypothetical protein